MDCERYQKKIPLIKSSSADNPAEPTERLRTGTWRTSRGVACFGRASASVSRGRASALLANPNRSHQRIERKKSICKAPVEEMPMYTTTVQSKIIMRVQRQINNHQYSVINRHMKVPKVLSFVFIFTRLIGLVQRYVGFIFKMSKWMSK